MFSVPHKKPRGLCAPQSMLLTCQRGWWKWGSRLVQLLGWEAKANEKFAAVRIIPAVECLQHTSMVAEAGCDSNAAPADIPKAVRGGVVKLASCKASIMCSLMAFCRAGSWHNKSRSASDASKRRCFSSSLTVLDSCTGIGSVFCISNQ